VISSQTEAAILIQEDVRVRTDIVNEGVLIGDRALDASETRFGLTFVQTGGASVGDLLFGSGADNVTIAGGLVFGEIDLGDGRNRFDGSGAAGDLVVTGGAGADRILGGHGDDVIDGGGGRIDLLAGGLGADVFRFGEELNDNGRRDVARITDFELRVDRLDIDRDLLAGVLRFDDRIILRFNGDDRDILQVDGIGRDVSLNDLLF
jgi:Ca2+-binding RTX toxin-like protein